MKKFCKILAALFLATLVTTAAACENSITDVRNRMREAEQQEQPLEPDVDPEFSQPEPDETPEPEQDEEPPVRLPHKRPPKPTPYPLPHGTTLSSYERERQSLNNSCSK